jgi:hypothetical protein
VHTWQETLTGVDRVRSHTAPEILEELDQALLRRLESHQGASDAAIGARLRELDDEWDIERVLIVNAATLASLGIAAGLVRRRMLLLPLGVGAFLLQHGLQGWCPPLAIFRRRGVRTRREIDLERYSLKALRGDLGARPTGDVDELVEQAVRR